MAGQDDERGRYGAPKHGADVQTDDRNRPDGDSDQSSPESARQLAASSVTRLTVNIGPATTEALQNVAQREGVTVTEALRRLVSYGDLLYRAVKVDGKDVLFRKDKETQQVLIP
jgi:hypothetical protein